MIINHKTFTCKTLCHWKLNICLLFLIRLILYVRLMTFIWSYKVRHARKWQMFVTWHQRIFKELERHYAIFILPQFRYVDLLTYIYMHNTVIWKLEYYDVTFYRYITRGALPCQFFCNILVSIGLSLFLTASLLLHNSWYMQCMWCYQ